MERGRDRMDSRRPTHGGGDDETAPLPGSALPGSTRRPDPAESGPCAQIDSAA